jgi:hypothetical protein
MRRLAVPNLLLLGGSEASIPNQPRRVRNHAPNSVCSPENKLRSKKGMYAPQGHFFPYGQGASRKLELGGEKNLLLFWCVITHPTRKITFVHMSKL